MSEGRPRWTLFIFCFNEVDNVGDTIDRVVKTGRNLDPVGAEVLVIDDGSTDGSASIIAQKCAQYENVRTIGHSTNKGIGQALLTGYRNSNGKFVCGIPADGQFDPMELVPYSAGIEKSVISFYRINKGYGPYRSMLTRFNQLMNRFLLNLRLKDVNWVKVYDAELLKQMDLTMTSSLVESEICAKMAILGTVFLEVPSIYHQRLTGKEKGGAPKTVVLALMDLFRLTLHLKGYKVPRAPMGFEKT